MVLKQWDEFIAGSGVQGERAELNDAEVVFVGYGIQAPEYDWDDYKGVDLKGKVLLMMNNDPDWDPELFGGEKRLWYGRWDYKYLSAAMQGAAGAIIIHTSPSAGYPFQVVQTSWTGVRYVMPEVIFCEENRLAVGTARSRAHAGKAVSGDVVVVRVLCDQVRVRFNTSDVAR